MMPPILQARGLVQIYRGRRAGAFKRDIVHAVDGVDIDVHEGETLAIVGESGSGKTTVARLLLRLAHPTKGSIAYRGVDLDRADRRAYRREIQAVFQDPSSSLNPRMRVETTLSYVIARHRLASGQGVRALIAKHLGAVGLDPPETFMTRYPHQLSGGQQQRVAIARAMMLEPRIIIADEPLSSLDISVQTQLLDLMRDLKLKTRVGFVLISHDLNAVEAIADRVAVMYRGRIVESGRRVIARPLHPYTRALVDARLIPDPRVAKSKPRIVLESDALSAQPEEGGCRFRNRCPLAIPICGVEDPSLRSVRDDDSLVACHRVETKMASA
jgi:oligopeptide/dipeptide ABC transporter ATP-binding protein